MAGENSRLIGGRHRKASSTSTSVASAGVCLFTLIVASNSGSVDDDALPVTPIVSSIPGTNQISATAGFWRMW